MANHRKGWEERKVESFDGFCVTKSTFHPHAPSSGEHGRRWYLDNGWSLSEN